MSSKKKYVSSQNMYENIQKRITNITTKIDKEHAKIRECISLIEFSKEKIKELEKNKINLQKREIQIVSENALKRAKRAVYNSNNNNSKATPPIKQLSVRRRKK
jgi:ribosome-binding ATPase YchF (GTP1/OBG family)